MAFLHIVPWLLLTGVIGGAYYIGITVFGIDVLPIAIDIVREHPIASVLGLLALVFVRQRWVRMFRLWYALHMSKKLVSMKVSLPRSDSKIDQEKRTEKDFKEKIAVMEQLYRALWEVRNLDFWEHLHFWIFRYATISFEMFVEKGQLSFYVLTQPKLVSIVEKQITAFYTDAEVTIEQAQDMRHEGQVLIGYNLSCEKLYVYPIREYDQMQEDPLNDIANVLSKLNEDELATVQMVLTPSFTNRWGKRTRHHANIGFKGRKAGWFSNIPVIGFMFEMMGSLKKGGGTSAPGASRGDAFVRMVQSEEELYKRMGEKGGMSYFHVSLRFLGSGKTIDRAIDITNNLQIAFNVFKD